MTSQGTPRKGTEGAVQYSARTLRIASRFSWSSRSSTPTTCLLPEELQEGGYDDSWLEGEVDPPATANEDLSSKPAVQEQFLKPVQPSGPIPTPQMKRNYLNFYGNLMKSSDAYLVELLDTLEATGLLENTLVSRPRTTARWARPRGAATEELQLL